MGISRNPTMIGSRQTAAGMTWLELKGQQIFKMKRAPGQSNPSPQYIQSQNAGRQLVAIFQKIADQVRAGFTSHEEKQSPYNAFYKYNYQNAFDLSSPPTATFMPSDALVSKGLITITPFDAAPVADASADTVALVWDNTLLDSTQLATDVVYLTVYNSTQDKWATGNGHAARSAGALTPSVPDGFMDTGDTVFVYMNFVGAPLTDNAGKSSTSVVQSVTVVA